MAGSNIDRIKNQINLFIDLKLKKHFDLKERNGQIRFISLVVFIGIILYLINKIYDFT